MKTFNPDPLQECLEKLKFLTQEQIRLIDEALCSIGEYGEVHLVIEKGNLRFVVLQKSYDANKAQTSWGNHD